MVSLHGLLGNKFATQKSIEVIYFLKLDEMGQKEFLKNILSRRKNDFVCEHDSNEWLQSNYCCDEYLNLCGICDTFYKNKNLMKKLKKIYGDKNEQR